jgi:hypothetical protein
MPELIPKSTAAPAPPPFPPGYPPIPPEIMRPAVPPIIAPAAWEDYSLFRETALLYVSEPEFNAALRTVGDYLFGMLLECYGDWPEWPESSTRTELHAAVADLRHLQGFLASVGQERRVSSLAPGDVRLSRYASGAARVLNRLANGIENRLAKEASS